MSRKAPKRPNNASSKKRRAPATPTNKSAADARAEAQAGNAERKAALAEAIEAHFSNGVGGSALVTSAIWPTVIFCVVSILAMFLEGPMLYAAAVVDMVLFGLGIVLFLVALYSGSQRSRVSDMTMSGWFFLVGAAPRSIQRIFVGSVVAQTVVAFLTASVRPFTALAFGILVPTFGIAITAVWSARFGYFPPRRDGDPLLGGHGS